MDCAYMEQNFPYAFPELAAWYSLKNWDFKLLLRAAVAFHWKRLVVFNGCLFFFFLKQFITHQEMPICYARSLCHRFRHSINKANVYSLRDTSVKFYLLYHLQQQDIFCSISLAAALCKRL